MHQPTLKWVSIIFIYCKINDYVSIFIFIYTEI